MANDAFGTILRSNRGSAPSEDDAVTAAADKGLDMAMEGLAALHAPIDHLTNETGEEPDGRATDEVESAFLAATDALVALRDAVDDALVERGLDPTTAAEVEADLDDEDLEDE